MHISFIEHWLCHKDKDEEIDLALFRLLHAVRREGSLKKAADAEGLSYRHAWGLIKKWGNDFNTPLVKLERGRGRGAQLTQLGDKFIWAEQYLNEKIGPALESVTSEINAALAEFIRPGSYTSIKMFASHGMAINHLHDLLRQDSRFDIDFQIRGSLEGLRNLANGQCQIAGFHFPEQLISEALAPLYSQWLTPARHSLLQVARRQQGIIVQHGNPKNISVLADLTKRSVRFINRQRDSGTRTIFDQLLQRSKIDSKRIKGYTNEEFTHVAVAAMIASDAADAGFGIKAAASQFKLGFLSVLEESYVLDIDNEIGSAITREIKRLLRSRQFREKIGRLAGYNVSQSGGEFTFEQLLGDNIE